MTRTHRKRHTPRRLRLRTATITAAGIIGLAACGGSDDGAATDTVVDSAVAADTVGTVPAETPPESGDDMSMSDDAVAERIEELQLAVDNWTAAESVAEAHAAAEAAINLVSGPNGPFSGDLDGDAVVQGASSVGLLSGIDGTPAGLATEIDATVCVVRDILGSTADDAAAGWAETDAAIDAWRPDNNTMPTLLSHPMRVIGWATFTLASDDLADAHEYASHAQLHVDVARNALTCPE